MARGFLASEEAFRFVQAMESEGRIVPVVGDFAGDSALPGIAAYLAREKLTVSAFYTSNVEQYLLEPKVWAKWARNVAALPTDDRSLFIRAYLDQGRRHPKELTGHRTATRAPAHRRLRGPPGEEAVHLVLGRDDSGALRRGEGDSLARGQRSLESPLPRLSAACPAPRARSARTYSVYPPP